MCLRMSVQVWVCVAAGAERVAGLVEDCLVRARCIPRAAAQQRFIAAVAGDLLQVACGRMLRIQQQADNFRDILSPHWAPKVCARGLGEVGGLVAGKSFTAHSDLGP
jgi:hypothetical protein